MAATLIDWVVLMPLAVIVAALNGTTYHQVGQSGFYLQGWGLLLFLVIGCLYSAAPESSRKQATLGKMAMDLYVTDVEGCRLTFGAAVIRSLLKNLSGVTLGIGFMMAAFTKKKQALHDMLARTLVAKS